MESQEHKEVCVCDLTEAIGSDMSTVSRHLAQLKNAGIVESEKHGATAICRGGHRSPDSSRSRK